LVFKTERPQKKKTAKGEEKSNETGEVGEIYSTPPSTNPSKPTKKITTQRKAPLYQGQGRAIDFKKKRGMAEADREP